MAEQEQKNIVIIGGGIIGCTSAYFLTRHPSYHPSRHRITLVEASTVAGAASGKAGGLLAKWAYPAPLVALSYRLHAELAAEHGGEQRWGYRRICAGQIEAKARLPPTSNTKTNKNTETNVPSSSDGAANATGNETASPQELDESATAERLCAAGLPPDLDWISAESARGYGGISGPDATAQVHPYQFTTSMAGLAREAGVRIVEHTRVRSIDRAAGQVESVSWTRGSDGEEETTRADSVVLAAGPWTPRLLPEAPIGALRAHSVVIRPARPVSGYALFTEIELPGGGSSFSGKKTKGLGGTARRTVAPEIYARPGGEVYACGEGDRGVPLPETSAEVETDEGRCEDIRGYVGSISDELREGEVVARQACYLPVGTGAGGGGPWVGEVRGWKGLVLASGHSCWGIQNGPGTGKCVSEVVMEGRVRSTKLGELDPMVSL